MGFAISNAFALLLLISCFNLFEAYTGRPVADAPTPAPAGHYPALAPTQPPTHRHHHAHPPSPSPTHHLPHAPTISPVYPAPRSPRRYAPVPSPSRRPEAYIRRSFVEVQGVVYCKSCKYPGVDTLLDAKPISGATVELSCKNTKYAPAIRTVTTDGNGYFRVAAPKNVTSYAFHRCKVYLVKSPEESCSKPSDLHGGADGADLKPAKAFMDGENKPVVLYNVGPLAFEPTCGPR